MYLMCTNSIGTLLYSSFNCHHTDNSHILFHRYLISSTDIDDNAFGTIGDDRPLIDLSMDVSYVSQFDRYVTLFQFQLSS